MAAAMVAAARRRRGFSWRAFRFRGGGGESCARCITQGGIQDHPASHVSNLEEENCAKFQPRQKNGGCAVFIVYEIPGWRPWTVVDVEAAASHAATVL